MDKIGETKKEIHTLEAEIASLTEAMEAQVPAILAATSSCLRDRIERCASGAVIAHPDKAKRAGKEGLSQMKGELSALLDRLDEEVEALVGADSVWVHRPADPESDATSYVRNPYSFAARGGGFHNVPDVLLSPMRRIMGMAGSILIDHGFAQLGSEWTKSTHGSITYRVDISGSEDLTNAGTPYMESHRRFRTATDSLRAAREKLARLEAQKLWDES